MPLSPPEARELLHRRDIELRGYHREDGLFDIEASLSDTKTYAFDMDERGRLEPGDKLHGMLARMTVDEELVVVSFEAAMEHTPYAFCLGAAPNFARLAGLTIGRGFLREATRRVGGTDGCTHLRELLQQMATVAYQTLYPIRMRRRRAAAGAPPALLDTCTGWSSESPVIARRWPELFTGGTKV